MERIRLAALLLAAFLLACTAQVVQPAPPASPPKPAPPAGVAASAVSAGELAGILVDETGAPLSGRVSLVWPSGSRTRSVSASGRFRFPDLAARQYVLTATTADGRIATVDSVVPGPGEHRVAVSEPGGRLAVSIAGRSAARLAVMQGDLRIHDLTLHEDRPSELVVPSGPLRLELYDTGLSRTKSLDLAPGERVELTFALGD